jgi:hypothetical protein
MLRHHPFARERDAGKPAAFVTRGFPQQEEIWTQGLHLGQVNLQVVSPDFSFTMATMVQIGYIARFVNG